MFSGFVYTPDANYFGAHSFTYQYSNAAGTELSNTATVTLTVTAVNDAPVAYDVAATTAEDNAITINLVATDVDIATASLVFGIQTQPSHGALLQNPDGSYRSTPAANYSGTGSFTYRASDGQLDFTRLRLQFTASAWTLQTLHIK